MMECIYDLHTSQLKVRHDILVLFQSSKVSAKSSYDLTMRKRLKDVKRNRKQNI